MTGGSGIGRIKRHPFAGIAAGDADPGDDRRLRPDRRRPRFNRRKRFRGARPQQTEVFEPPPGAAADVERRGQAKGCARRSRADRLAALGPNRRRAVEPGVQRRAVVMPAVTPQHDGGANAMLRLRRAGRRERPGPRWRPLEGAKERHAFRSRSRRKPGPIAHRGYRLSPVMRDRREHCVVLCWLRQIKANSPDLDRIILDHRVGEQLPAHLFDPRARRGGVAYRRDRARSACPAAPRRPRRTRDPSAHCRSPGPADRAPPGLRLIWTRAFTSPSPYCIVLGAGKSPGPLSGRMPSRRATS